MIAVVVPFVLWGCIDHVPDNPVYHAREKLLFLQENDHRPDEPDESIVLMDAQTGDTVTIDQQRYLSDPRLSPSGSRILYRCENLDLDLWAGIRGTRQNYQMRLVDMAALTNTRIGATLAEPEYGFRMVDWLTDSTLVIGTGGVTNKLYLLDLVADTIGVFKTFHQFDRIWLDRVSPDGRSVIIHFPTHFQGFAVWRIGEEEAHIVIDSVLAALFHSWSPDNNEILYVRDWKDTLIMCRYDMRTGKTYDFGYPDVVPQTIGGLEYTPSGDMLIQTYLDHDPRGFLYRYDSQRQVSRVLSRDSVFRSALQYRGNG